MKFGENSKKFLVVFMIIVVSFFVARNDSKSVLNSLFINVLAPLENKIATIGFWVSGKKDYYVNMSKVYQDNKKLKSDINDLQTANIATAEIWAENQRLRALLNYKQDSPSIATVTAKVIGVSPAKIKNEIIINRGRLQGLTENMPVITNEGLVGCISMVYDNSAKVSLLSHLESSVGGVVQRPASRAVGIVTGEMVEEGYLKLNKLPRDADVQLEDLVVTSGLGGVYPRGIFIGEVVKVVNEDGGLLKYAVIKPKVNFNKLEEVLVITNAAAVPDATPNSILKQQKAADIAAREAALKQSKAQVQVQPVKGSANPANSSGVRR